MSVSGIIVGLGMLATPLFDTPTPPAICSILQTAFATAVAKGGEVYPQRVAPARQGPMELAGFVPGYTQRLGLAPGEFEDLAANQKKSAGGSLVPNYAWKGIAASIGPEGPGVLTSFGSPILSSDGKLALVEVSFAQGISAHGQLCILRRAQAKWTGRCHRAWSIR